MLTLGPLAFGAPLALIALATLPLIWLLLRVTPPAPRRRIFAPWRLLLGIEPPTHAPERTPWWLMLLRLVIAALVILGLARPVLFPPPPAGGAALILVLDDGWGAAPNWPRIQRAATGRLEAAAQDGRRAALVLTAPAVEPASPLALEDPREIIRRLAAAKPRPWPVDRKAAAARIEAARAGGALPQAAEAVWLTDGLASEGTEILAASLARFGAGLAVTPAEERAPLGLVALEPSADGFAARVVRAATGAPRTGSVLAIDADGRALARAPFAFAEGETAAQAQTTLPLEVRNRSVLARLESGGSAGGAQVLGDGWRRPLIGLVSARAQGDRQPLLADLHYVEQALAPVAETRRGLLADLLEQRPGGVVLTDAGRVLGPEAADLARFIAEGGLLIRFAGPRLAAQSDDLTPVRLRVGGRALGGALAWDAAQPLAPFAATSPFYGLAIPEDVRVSQQVLAEPAPDLAERSWARLADGTPLVTAERRGRGRIVLFHVGASPDWSNLPISGLFPQMLGRVAAFAQAGAPPDAEARSGAWRLDAALDAEGRLAPAKSDAALAPDAIAAAVAGPAAPPGRYVRGGEGRAINVLGPDVKLAPFPAALPGLRVEAESAAVARPLAGPLLGLALGLLVLDALAMMLLSGRFSALAAAAGRRLRPTAAAGALAALALAGAALSPPRAEADDKASLALVSELRLAYVKTGDAKLDAMSEAGLRGLSRQLFRRTTIEPADPVGVDVERDEIGFLPMLYWPVAADAKAPSPAAAERLDRFLKTGGVIVFDTQDGGAPRREAVHPGLARIAAALDIPPLDAPPPDHVLTRAFFLLQDFPGRWRDGSVWVEADAQGSARDGVSSVIVGSADWAAAWAIDEEGRPLAAPIPGGELQREMAYRFGINLVMYVLTGNYKADQVHIPAILERLGQ